MQQKSGPAAQLATHTAAHLAALDGHPWVAQLRDGTLSRRQYELVLWGIRGLCEGLEQAVWASRSEHVIQVRENCVRLVPLLERDLVAVCGKELTVPSSVNRVLDGFSAGAARGATPARLLGRLWVIEQVVARLAVGCGSVQARHGAAELTVTHFLGAYASEAEHAEVLDAAYRTALVGEVPMQNALEGARETFAQLEELLAELDRSATQRAVAS